MKDFMLVFIGKNYNEMGLSPEDMQTQMGKWWTWHNQMESAGIIKDGHALHPEIKRISGSDRTITDIAATEVKELIGGYYVIHVADEAAAIEAAQGYPDYDLGGTVEIREIMKMSQ